MHQNGFADVIGNKDPAGTFQDDEFDVGILVEFEHYRRAGNCGSYRCGIDFCAAGVLRYPQQHRAIG